MKSKLLITTVFLFFMVGVSAQSYEYSRVKGFRVQSSGTIIKDGKVTGYNMLYPVEKADKKNAVFAISLLDENLDQVFEFEFVRHKDYFMIESTFNDNAFIFSFYDRKAKAVEFVTFDRSGKELGSYKTPKLKMSELVALGEVMNNPEIINNTVFPIGNAGFMRVSAIKEKKLGYKTVAYDNNMKQLWEYGSASDAAETEVAEVIATDENYVLLHVTKSRSRAAAKLEPYLILLDAKTGKTLYDFKTVDENDGLLSVINGFLPDDSGEAFIVGEYYDPTSNPGKDKSMGLYMLGVEKNGEYSFFKKFSWDKEIAQVKKESLSEEELEKEKANELIYFHHFLKAENGHVFAIGENYRKQASAAGIASLALHGAQTRTALAEIRIGNMVLVEFDKDMNMVNYEIIPKRRSRVNLPQGALLYSPQYLGRYIKALNYFDYSFTSKNPDRDSYHAFYTDMDRKDVEAGKKANIMGGVINVVDGKSSVDKFPIHSKAKYLWVSPAKPGYLMIGEYYKKNKRVLLRLEKISE